MDAPSLTNSRIARGGVALVATVQWALAVFVAASAWAPVPFTLATQQLSDLGVPECVVAARVVCSPQWFVFDAALLVHAIAVVVAVFALRSLLPEKRRTLIVATALVHALFTLVMAAVPADPTGGVRDQVHLVATLIATVAGGALALRAGFQLRSRWRGWAGFSMVLGAVAVVAGILSALGVGADTAYLDTVGFGAVVLWTVGSGFALLNARRGEFERERIRAAQEGR